MCAGMEYDAGPTRKTVVLGFQYGASRPKKDSHEIDTSGQGVGDTDTEPASTLISSADLIIFVESCGYLIALPAKAIRGEYQH